MKIRMMAVGTIRPYDRNPRRLNNGVAKVRASLEEFGWRQPIVVDAHKTIVVGHTRYLAALDMELTHVPVLVANDLTPEQAKAYRIADNRTGAETSWDDSLLRLELKDLAGGPVDLAALGFNAAELNDLLGVPDLDKTGSGGGGGDAMDDEGLDFTLHFGSAADRDAWLMFLRHLRNEYADTETDPARVAQYLRDNLEAA